MRAPQDAPAEADGQFLTFRPQDETFGLEILLVQKGHSTVPDCRPAEISSFLTGTHISKRLVSPAQHRPARR